VILLVNACIFASAKTDVPVNQASSEYSRDYVARYAIDSDMAKDWAIHGISSDNKAEFIIDWNDLYKYKRIC
jgi:hypothetical protein